MSAKETKIMEELIKYNTILTGHFVYTSGLHGDKYINKDAIYPHAFTTHYLCQDMILPFIDQIDVVVGAEKGGITLCEMSAFHLQVYNTTHKRKEVLAAYAEKTNDGLEFRRGYDKLIPGKKILVVEDILTTGGTVLKLVNLVRSLNGIVVAVSAICNRGGITAADIGGAPLTSLVNVELKTYRPEECPLCKAGVPINTDVGHGKAFLAQQQASV